LQIAMAKPSANASMDEKINYLVDSFSDLKSLVHDNQKRVTFVETEVDVLKKEVTSVKEKLNRNEQQAKGLNIRVIGLPTTPTESTSKYVYDRILKPILIAAKEAGKITAVPQVNNAVTDAFRMRSRSGAAPSDHPPHILVKLPSSAIKSAIFSHKKGSIPTPSEAEKAAGARMFIITEDLTPTTYKFLKLLKADRRVLRAWTTEGVIKYILADDPQKQIRRTTSVFEHVDVVISKQW